MDLTCVEIRDQYSVSILAVSVCLTRIIPTRHGYITELASAAAATDDVGIAMPHQKHVTDFQPARLLPGTFDPSSAFHHNVKRFPSFFLGRMGRTPASSKPTEVLQPWADTKHRCERRQRVMWFTHSLSRFDPHGHIPEPPGHQIPELHAPPWRHQPRRPNMHLMNWNTYRQHVVAGVGNVARLSPDTVKGYAQLSQANAKDSHLGAKTSELIALAVAISLRCDGCIAVHTAEAKKAGTTKEEIAEALGIAISVNAGAALVYSTRTMDALDAATEA
jgi:AhpD family alkylhydroperoxidase